MKQIKIISLLTWAVLISCQNETTEPSYNDDPSVVKIEVTAGGSLLTRSNPASDAPSQKRFNPGDQIAISADTQSTVVYTFGNTWTPETGKNLKWESNTMTFSACSPATTGTTMKNFTLPADQSTAPKIATADYMTFRGSKDKPADNSSISIALERRMARVVIKIEKISPVYAKDKSYITDVAIRSGAASYADSVASGNVTSVAPFGQRLNASNQGILNSTYTALVIPTEAKSDEAFITLTDGAGKALSVKGIPALEAGKSYTYKLSVGQRELEIKHVTVENWNEGTTIGGDKEEAALVLFAPKNMVITNELIKMYVCNGELTLGGEWTTAQFNVVSSYCKNNYLTKLDFSQTTGLTSLGREQFCGSAELVTIKLPITVTILENDAFANCSKLTTIDGLENIVKLGKHPFSSCNSLQIINCPKVTRMGDELFYKCTGLTEIRFTAESFMYVYSHVSGAHFHPFSGYNIDKITLYLNASQETRVVTENNLIVWKPFGSFSSATGYSKPIPLTGFKAIYCGDTKIYPN